jgi:hypothetical protein
MNATETTLRQPTSSDFTGEDPFFGFTKDQRAALEEMRDSIGIDKFNTVKDQDWLKKRGCGKLFVKKLTERGWVKPENQLDGLTLKVREKLKAILDCELTKEEIINQILRGCLYPGMRYREGWSCGYGMKYHQVVCEWSGISNMPVVRKWKYDPFTGKELAR